MIVAIPRTILTVVLLLVLVRQLDCLCVSCHLPSNATDKDVERLILMDFKERLMKKLGLTKEPKNVAAPPLRILKAISNQGLQIKDQPRQTTEPSAKITDIVASPFKSKFNLVQNMLSCSFQLLEVKGAYEVDSVKLWLHEKHVPAGKHWFQVYDSTRWGKRLVLNQTISSSTPDWCEFKFHPNRAWRKTPWKKLHLVIAGIIDKRNETVISVKDNAPLLQVLPRPIKKRLFKRNNAAPIDDCPRDGLCCKQSYYIDVTKQMPWIILPTMVQTGICNGTCPTLYRSRWVWSMVLQIQDKRQPCCVPTKLSPISTIHRNEKGNLVQTLVEDMVVDSCGCS